MLRHQNNLQMLERIPLPAQTDTYVPVSHQSIFTNLSQKIEEAGLVPTNPYFHLAAQGKVMLGFMDVNAPSHLPYSDEYGFKFVVMNSYNKQLAVRAAAGLNVFICSNGAISGEITFMHKHTGNVIEELHILYNSIISRAEHNYRKIVGDFDMFKQTPVNREDEASILGTLFFKEQLLTPQQASRIRTNITTSSNRAGSVYDVYQNITNVLKDSHPISHFRQHTKLHNALVNICSN